MKLYFMTKPNRHLHSLIPHLLRSGTHLPEFFESTSTFGKSSSDIANEVLSTESSFVG